MFETALDTMNKKSSSLLTKVVKMFQDCDFRKIAALNEYSMKHTTRIAEEQ